MLVTTYWIMGTGLAMVSVGYSWYFQGLAPKIKKQTKNIWISPYMFGTVWAALGLFLLAIGFFTDLTHYYL